MKVYAYHPVDFKYVGEITLNDSDRSPLEPDVFLIPANCVNIAPPSQVEGFVRVWANGAWVQSVASPEDPEIPVEPTGTIPRIVSPFQARAALDEVGLLEAVEALIQDPATPKKDKLAWMYAQEFRRDSPTVLAMSAQLGITEEQLDALFLAASQIIA